MAAPHCPSVPLANKMQPVFSVRLLYTASSFPNNLGSSQWALRQWVLKLYEEAGKPTERKVNKPFSYIKVRCLLYELTSELLICINGLIELVFYHYYFQYHFMCCILFYIVLLYFLYIFLYIIVYIYYFSSILNYTNN